LKKSRRIFDTHKENSFEQYFLVEKKPDILIRPNERVLVCTIEQITMPNNMVGLVGLRSTYSRLGLQMPLGFVDPGFIGQLTLELSGGPFPVMLHEGDKVFHVMFVELNQTNTRTYRGKYQNQRGVKLPSFSR